MRVRRFLKEFSETAYGAMLDELNLVLSNLGLDNLNGHIVKVTLPSNIEIAIPHRLKKIPKYRIILRQSSSGSIIDGSKSWASNIIYLKNTGATENIVTLLII